MSLEVSIELVNDYTIHVTFVSIELVNDYTIHVTLLTSLSPQTVVFCQ